MPLHIGFLTHVLRLCKAACFPQTRGLVTRLHVLAAS